MSPEHPDDPHSGDPIEPKGEDVPGGSGSDDLEQASLDELIALLGDGASTPDTPDASEDDVFVFPASFAQQRLRRSLRAFAAVRSPRS